MNTKYDQIGNNYNVTREADPYLTKKLIELLIPNADGVYLDIGCGTGNYTIQLYQAGIRMIGMDPSEKMLQHAKKKNASIDWRKGIVEDIGLPDNSIDGIIATLTIHHWTDLKKGFSELSRVLKKNGKLVIFTSSPEQMKGYWLNHYFPKMMEDSRFQMPGLDEIKSAMAINKLEIIDSFKYFVKPDLKDKFLYCGKESPELYFKKEIRNGISSFTSLANKAEVNLGLTKLKSDLKKGTFQAICDSYSDKLGDYLFILGKKPAHNNVYKK